MLVFVGERRSPTAKRMGVTWEDGRLAAKQLFDAFDACGYRPESARFANLFEHGGVSKVVEAARRGYRLIAMGLKVQANLAKRGLPFVPMVHPAARGAIRKKEIYAAEVRRALVAAGALQN